MKRILIAFALLLGASVAVAQEKPTEKPKQEVKAPPAAPDPTPQLKAALDQCRTKVGELTLLIDGVQAQINAGQIGATQQIQSATIATLLKRIEEKNPQYALNVATGEITLKKETGK